MMTTLLSPDEEWRPIYRKVCDLPKDVCNAILQDFSLQASLNKHAGRFNHELLREILELHTNPAIHFPAHFSQMADEYNETMKAQEIIESMS